VIDRPIISFNPPFSTPLHNNIFCPFITSTV
jgi:hypothetical protein